MKELEAGGPSAGLGQLGAAVQASCPHLPSALGPASSFFKPQMFAFLRTAREGDRVLKAANRFWKRQESKMTHGGKQPSVTPGPAWHGHQLSPRSSFFDSPFRWLA